MDSEKNFRDEIRRSLKEIIDSCSGCNSSEQLRKIYHRSTDAVTALNQEIQKLHGHHAAFVERFKREDKRMLKFHTAIEDSMQKILRDFSTSTAILGSIHDTVSDVFRNIKKMSRTAHQLALKSKTLMSRQFMTPTV